MQSFAARADAGDHTAMAVAATDRIAVRRVADPTDVV